MYFVKNFKRLAGTLHALTKFLFWLSVVCGVLSLLLLAVVLLAPEGVWQRETGTFLFSAGGVLRYRLEPPPGTMFNLRPLLLAAFGVAPVLGGGFALIQWQLMGILETVLQDKPFAPANAGRIKVLGIILLAGSVLISVIRAVMAYAGIKTFAIANMDVAVTVDLSMLLIGLLLLVLAGVFRYGNYLQDEVDATL